MSVANSKRISSALLPRGERLPKIRTVRRPFEQEVNVIGHDAVRENLKLPLDEERRDLRRQLAGVPAVCKPRMPLMRADS